jgi:Gp5-like OB domain-containing protein
MRMRRRVAVVVVGAAALLGVAGIAYATIPDGGAVYTACMLKNVGTIRLIDPSGPSGSLLSRCTGLETQITWNGKGQKGDPGPAGPAGANGVSPTVAQLQAGDSHCPAGGAAITDANGSTAYVCSGQNGQNGKDGQPFSGTFTSPNGQFSLTVADGGVQIVGPSASIGMDSSGDITIKGGNVETVAAGDETVKVGGSRTETVGNDETITIGHDRTETVDNDETITIGHDRTETVDNDESVSVGGDRSETVSKNESVQVGVNRSESVGGNDKLTVGGDRSEAVGGSLELDAVMLGLNAGSACRPVARYGDPIDLLTLMISGGSPDVCID